MLISSSAAAQRLGIKPETLYAYVSRGLLTPVERRGGRGSWFDPAEIDAFASSRRRRGGDTVVESSLTLIEHGTYAYRGRPASLMAAAATFEQTAEWLWLETTEPRRWEADAAWTAVAREARQLAATSAPPRDVLRLGAAAIACNDRFAADVGVESVVATARRLIPSLVGSLAPDADSNSSVAMTLARALGGDHSDIARMIDRTLVILADHGMAASTVACRVAASYGAGIHAAVGAALSAFSGHRHGAASELTERLLRDARSVGPETVLADELRSRGTIPGLGHPLYPEGDPRYRLLVDALTGVRPDHPMAADLRAIEETVDDRGLPPPNVDMALGAIVVGLGLPPNSGELLFATGRMAGWVAHALEAYAQGSPIRPRARYVGAR